MTRLLTLGCSWVRGVGAEYDASNPQDKKTYQRHCQDDGTWKYAFRTLLSQKYGLRNVNLSAAGSSNHAQSRKLREYLHKNSLEDTIVLWGVTSIYRMEMWFNNIDAHWCFQPTQKNNSKICGPKWCGPKQFFWHHFDEANENRTLSADISHWQRYFSHLGVPQIWFDTLNVNKYVGRLYNKFDTLPYPCNQDLLSQLAYKNGWSADNDKYHHSNWEADCDRIHHLAKAKVVNPWSYHPTRQGHEQIAEMLDPYLKNILDNHRPKLNPYTIKWNDVHD